MADISENIGAAIRSARSATGLSLQEVADRAGLSKAHVWELEQGRAKNPTVGCLYAISRATGVSVLELLGEEAATPPIHPIAMRLALDVDAELRRNKHGGQDV